MAASVRLGLKKRTIHLYGEIESSSARALNLALRALEKESDEPGQFFINSIGGNFAASVEMHHALCNTQLIINTIGWGKVRSGALFILQGGDKRFATANCRLEIHQPFLEFKKKSSLNSSQSHEYAWRLEQADAVEIYILTKRGSPVFKITALLRKDAAINAKEALKLKLIDGIWRKPIR